jgi:quinol monooxygenase YgiN
MIRHSVLFAWADDVPDEAKLRMKEGMAYVAYASNLLDLDFGEDLGIGGADEFGLILLHDHRSREAWDEYNKDPHHHRVGEYIKQYTNPQLAARVDWMFGGERPPRHTIRHMAMYLWKHGVSDAQKSKAKAAMAALRSGCPTVRSLEVGDDLGWYPPNYHWIVEAIFDDEAALKAFLEHPQRLAAEELAREVTVSERTARGQHRVRSG